jgi:hypothetical protein
MSCPVCIESFSAKLRKEIKCSKCNYSSCKKCFTQFLENVEEIEPYCMNCNYVFNTQFLQDNLPKVFIKKQLYEHLGQNMINYQITLLPNSQESANILLMRKKHIEFKKDILENIGKCKHKIDRLKYRYDINYNFDNFYLNELENNERAELENDNNLLENTNIDNIDINVSKKVINFNRFIKKCVKSDCRGFVNEKFICSLCKTKLCKKCQEPLNENLNEPLNENVDKHECDQNTIKTLMQIRKDSKPCPDCKIPILKIDGCSQIWCTECKCTFSWTTGKKLVNVKIHNPHYYEWLRSRSSNGEIPRDPEDPALAGVGGALEGVGGALEGVENNICDNYPSSDSIQYKINIITNIFILKRVENVDDGGIVLYNYPVQHIFNESYLNINNHVNDIWKNLKYTNKHYFNTQYESTCILKNKSKNENSLDGIYYIRAIPECHRNIQEFYDHYNNNIDNFDDIRAKYLAKIITKDQFDNHIKIEYRNQRSSREYQEISEMIYNCSSIIFQNFLNFEFKTLKTVEYIQTVYKKLKETYDELLKLISYTNECIYNQNLLNGKNKGFAFSTNYISNALKYKINDLNIYEKDGIDIENIKLTNRLYSLPVKITTVVKFDCATISARQVFTNDIKFDL